jgi:hypothetical protein
MPRVKLPITSGFYVSQSKGFADVRLVNMHPVESGNSTTGSCLIHTPGIVERNTVLPIAGVSRGGIVVRSLELRVIGDKLVLNRVTIVGDIEGTKDVTMASNGINVSIQVQDGKNYFYDIDTLTLTENTDAVYLSYGSVKSVVEYRGYYVYNTSTVFFTGSYKDTNDGKDFNALDFEDAELNPDGIVRLFVSNDQLYVIGVQSIEVYRIIVTSGFPFQRIDGATIQLGTFSVHGIAEYNNGFALLGGAIGQRPGVYHVIGSSFSRLSNESIEYIIGLESSGSINSARCFSYGENGSYFAVFTFDGVTLVFDSTYGKWHSRQSGIGNGDSFFNWRAVHGLRDINDDSINVGDLYEPWIGRLDSDYYKEYDAQIERVIPTIPFQDDVEDVFNHEIELYMRTGLGNGDVEEPLIRMDYSDDGGYVFGTERFRSLGKIGQRGIRVRWNRLGRSAISRVFRWRVTDPVPVEIFGLYGDIES